MTSANVGSGPASDPRRDLLVDSILVAALAAFLMVGTFFATHQHAAARPFDVGAVVLVIAAAGPWCGDAVTPLPSSGQCSAWSWCTSCSGT